MSPAELTRLVVVVHIVVGRRPRQRRSLGRQAECADMPDGSRSVMTRAREAAAALAQPSLHVEAAGRRAAQSTLGVAA